LTAKDAEIIPKPNKTAPASKTFLAPYRRINFELGIANTDKHEAASDPTNASVDGGARPSRTNAAWMTPKEYEDPEKKNLFISLQHLVADVTDIATLQAATTTHP